jgi:predicted O-methyltransferase YrrM
MKRYEWLTDMIRIGGFKYGAEIGTGNGKMGMELMSRNPSLYLIQIAYYPNLPGEINKCTTLRSKEMWERRMKKFKSRLIILETTSHKAVDKIADGTLDFIFIDADHSYEHCIEDIQDWVPKVKRHGLISGHDFGHVDFPGVEVAVREYFGENFKLADDRVWYSWKTVQ